jgi:hypothetical protein
VAKKAEPKPTPGKRQAGYLICETCKRAVAYQGMADLVGGSDWPLHRCGLEVRSFDRFELTDPFRPELPKVEGAYPEGWV